jgi:hypothetical protein
MCIAAGQDLVHVAVALPIVRPVDEDAAEMRRKKVYGLTILDLHQLHAVRVRLARTPSLGDRRGGRTSQASLARVARESTVRNDDENGMRSLGRRNDWSGDRSRSSWIGTAARCSRARPRV